VHLIPFMLSPAVTRPAINTGLAVSNNDFIFCGKPVAPGTELRGCVLTVFLLRDSNTVIVSY
jgi:hypothetical protein